MFVLRLLVIALLVGPSMAAAQITGCWYLGEYSTVTMSYTGGESMTLLVLPDGSGDPFSMARLPGGTVADATLTLTLHDCFDVPIAGVPSEDLWLTTVDGGLANCATYTATIADNNTDADGVTTWSVPPHAGGHSEAGIVFMVSGSDLFYSQTPMNLNFVSPDLNGDLMVNLSDIVAFVSDLEAGAASRSDFNHDGAVNLSDVIIMVGGLGADCP